ncbi:hypothetical protein [Shewanella kaireitica]|nr:hypothetical protein [Shewanella kaireitica]
MDIKPLLKVTLVVTLCVIMHRWAYTGVFAVGKHNLGVTHGY